MKKKKTRGRKSRATVPLKGLSHQFETGKEWSGSTGLALERCLWWFIIFSVVPSIFNSNSNSPSGLAKASGYSNQ
jgi:hypothetical protein